MAWFDELSDPVELQRCVRDLIALSTLPAIWAGMSPDEICESVASALVSMLDAELVYVWLPARPGCLAIEVAHTRLGPADGMLVALRRYLRPWANGKALAADRTIANPFGGGELHLASAAVGCGPDAIIISGSAGAGYPKAAQQLLLDLAADELGISLHRWQLEGGERRYQMLVERSPDFIGMADPEGRVFYLNPSGLALVGLPDLDAATDKHVCDFIAEPDRKVAGDMLEGIATKPGRWTGELRFLTFDSCEEIPFLVDWFLVEEPRTQIPASIVMVGRDLRPQRRAERAVHKASDGLKRRVLDSTFKLASTNARLNAETLERQRCEKRFRELRQELFHASRLSAAGQIAASLAHELSQPLTAGINSLNAAKRMLAAEGLSPQADSLEVIDEAMEQITRASLIIQRLGDFVRPGKARRQSESIKSILDDAIALAMIGTKGLGIELTVRQAPEATHAYADRVQVQQVIVNLIRNAVDAMTDSPRRELLVSVELRTPMIEFAISDSGFGLSPEIAEHLFQPFVTTKATGMGLGLSICQSIVHAHGGVISAAPNEGGGTIFRFTLEPSPQEGSS